jgi:gliding motility-associated-like protein
MRKIIFIHLLLLLSFKVQAQCVASASADKTQVYCNECVTLSGQGNTGTSVFNEDFNGGSPTGWAFTQAGDYSNPCSSAGVDGSPHVWMGSSSVNPRDMETVPFDLTLGGTICFDMLYAVQGGSSPCEGPDLPSEGVYLQYSVDGGATWVNIAYHDPLGGRDPALTNWGNYCYPIPAAAMTASTQIRWHQDAVSGADYDHWGIDNVDINLNDPLLMVSWIHDGYNYGAGNTGGVNPNQVCSPNDTSLILMVTNGTITCYDTIDIKVKIPVVNLDLSPNDTAICEGSCIQITGKADMVLDSGGIKVYENKQPEVINSTGGGFGNVFSSVSVDLNVQGLNMQTVQPNSITEVCITGLSAYRSTFAGTLDIGKIEVELSCPSGGTITLVDRNTTSGGGGLGYNNGYTSTCFVPAGPSIATGTVPYTGSWQTNDPFNNLAGCTSNGVWTLTMSEVYLPLNMVGELEGFSITFDDDSITYPGVVSWNHGTWLSDPSVYNPIACPTSDTSYILTITDSNNCVSKSDTVNITLAPVPDAGRDSTYSTCSPTPVNLFNYLGGTPSGGGIWLGPSGSIVNMPITPGVAPTGNYKYVVSNIAGCNDTAIVTLNTGGVQPIDVLHDTTICSNQSLSIDFTTPNSTYLWSTGETTPTITTNSAGTIWVNATEPTYGCTLTDTLVVTVIATPFAGDDGNAVICESGAVDLFTYLQNGPNAGGTWYNPSGTVVSMPIFPITGAYKYVVSNGTCSDTATVTITYEIVIADFDYSPSDVILINETEVLFEENSTNALYHEWIIDNISESFGAVFIRRFGESKFFDVCLVSYNDYCYDTICKSVNVVERIGVFVPNSFTPDTDGKNEDFGPSISGVITNYELRIFNRWGQIIFYGDEITERWDGNFNGFDAPSGIYVWKINYRTNDGGGKKEIIGHVNLMK